MCSQRFDFFMELLTLITKDILVMIDLLNFSFSRFNERDLVVDDVFQTADEPPHLSDGGPVRVFRGREGIAVSRSLPAIEERTERNDRHSGLEIFNREAGRRFFLVSGKKIRGLRGRKMAASAQRAFARLRTWKLRTHSSNRPEVACDLILQ